jgi:hypothetical protein
MAETSLKSVAELNRLVVIYTDIKQQVLAKNVLKA